MLLPEMGMSILVVTVLSAIAIFVFRYFTEDREFVTKVFLVALLARLIFGIFVHVYDLREFFGGDATIYDKWGQNLSAYWLGTFAWNNDLTLATSPPGWGLVYFVGGIYTVIGRN
ncbi:MAG: hypothetical protein JO053_11720, partial [Acidobacteria bacterium]|nr:hypothetical protein [Acidobacteriota bacterium]